MIDFAIQGTGHLHGGLRNYLGGPDALFGTAPVR